MGKKVGDIMYYSIGAFQIFDKLTGVIRSRCNPSTALRLEFSLHNNQKYLGLAITILGFILSVVVAIKTDSLSILLAGICWSFVYPIIFWSNIKILKELQILPIKFKGKISNNSYMDIIIVQTFIISIVIFFASLYFSIFQSSIYVIIIGVLYSLLSLLFIPYIARHELIGLTDSNSAEVWDDALSLLSLPLRFFCRLSGAIFTISNVFWVLVILYAIYLVLSSPEGMGVSRLYMGLGFLSAGSVALYAGSPIIIYLFALPVFLLVTIIARIAGDRTATQDGDLDLNKVEVHITSITSESMILGGQQTLDLYRSGTIAPDTLVWTEGMEEWLPVSKLSFD
jgi:hypothetical protein